MNQAILFLRALIFYTLYVIFTTTFSLSALLFIWFLPFDTKYNYIANWNRCVIWMGEYICGVKYRVHGIKNLPRKTPIVVLAKHSSQWETFFTLLLLQPVSIILKQELLGIPGFGWGLRMLKPIPIDRSNPKQSIKQIRSEGLQRLKEEKMPVLIFPEGTRIEWGKKGKYARGGAALAIEAGVPVVFISHNAGYFWPHKEFIKKPGTIDVIISEPIDPSGMTPRELTAMAEEWIESHIIEPK